MFRVLFAPIIRSTTAAYSLWLYAPETCRANDERNNEYSIHLVGSELNIYVTKIYGITNIKNILHSLSLHSAVVSLRTFLSLSCYFLLVAE
jgi:hypothetical protein